MAVIQETFKLNNGLEIPKVGFGTWQIPKGEVAYEATLTALKLGYRHIDTARGYDNEVSVGQAIRDSGIPREAIFLTTKLPAQIKTYEGALESFEKSMSEFGDGIDYVDLYLIHAPWDWAKQGQSDHKGNLEAWRAMSELQAAGRIKSIGISNFNVEDTKNILENAEVKPVVNQIRWFVGNTQDEITAFCAEHDILIEAYSPLATGALLEDPALKSIADKYGVSIPQICLRYCIEKGVLPLPKSTHANYIENNAAIDFEMDADDVRYLDSLNYNDHSLSER